MSVLRGSIVIPAHNEGAVIGRTLAALAPLAAADGVQVTVACNGCTDDTAGVARSVGWATVVETPVASKAEALRAAERVTRDLPRLYLDADIVLSSASARALLEHLAEGTHPAARPPLRYDTSAASRPVRSYYRARSRVPYLTRSLWGAGVYGLSEEGRGRFRDFPDVTADDLFVAQHFAPAEVAILDLEPVTVLTPRRVADLTRVHRRTYRGQAELGAAPRVVARTATRTSTASTASPLRTLCQLWLRAGVQPMALMDAAVYAALTLTSRAGARVVRSSTWETDR